VILDIFGHLVVGQLIAEREDAEMVQQLIADSVARYSQSRRKFIHGWIGLP
jgi:hypothetical protein